MKKLTNVLIDSIIELTSERDSINVDFDILSENREMIVVRMAVIEEQMVILEYEKLELKCKLYLMIEKS